MASKNLHQNTRGISETEAQQLATLALGDLEEVPVQTCLGPSNAMLVTINDDYLYHDMVMMMMMVMMVVVVVQKIVQA